MEEARRQRRDRAVAQTRDEIRQAFLRVLARKGFGGTTIEDVAREAGFAAGTLYNYFASKDELVQAVWEWVVGLFVDTLASPVPDGIPFSARLRFVTERLLELADRQGEVVLVLVHLPLQSEPGAAGAAVHRPHFARVMAAMRALLQPGVDEGLFPADRLDHYAIFFHGLIDGLVMHWALGGASGSIRELSGDLVDFFLRGVTR